ncbi:flagellar assembly peptidoglycan hydrolase FlgJ [Comamonas guangdongensis]|uniref:Flagellar assembly peptidoglycan hydrolase FlgJ n=1 Tax=Comamonas guangdongensis TaxID=510515 RepID=A0ABV3ZSA5_9BURK
MLRSDWPALPALPSFSSVPAAGGAWSVGPQPAVAAAGAGMPPEMGAAGYTPLGQEVAREVQQFIAQGGSAAALPSPQAQWLAMQALRQTERKSEAAGAAGAADRSSAADGAAAALQPAQQAFLDRIGPWAQQAAQRLGVSARAVMAHAALESGWGQRPVRDAQGLDSLNLFGIKAQGSWSGASTQAMTTEYEDGQAVQQAQSFRQYASLDATFADYVNLLAHSPRYRSALRTGNDVQAFAGALAAGGYATDPDYAQKLVRISRQIPQP